METAFFFMVLDRWFWEFSFKNLIRPFILFLGDFQGLECDGSSNVMLIWFLFVDLTSVCHLCSWSIIWIATSVIVLLIVGIVFLFTGPDIIYL